MKRKIFSLIMILSLLVVPLYSLISSPLLLSLFQGLGYNPFDRQLSSLVDGAESSTYGTGPDLTSYLRSENLTTITQATGVNFNDFNLSGPTGNEWVTTNTNFTFTDLYAENLTDYDYETGAVGSINSDASNYLFQGFQVNTSCRIINLSIYVIRTVDDSPDLRVRIRKDNGSGFPDTSLPGVVASSSFIELPLGWHWEAVSFNDEILNVSETYNNTFWVAVEMSGGAQMNWEYGTDSPNIGKVYRGTGASLIDQEGIYGEIDMDLRMSLAPLSNTPTADQIGLQVNGTNVTSSNQWISTEDWNATSSEKVYFNVTSDWTVNYTLDTNMLFERSYTTPTNFSISSNDNVANWSANISSATFGSTGQSNKTITISIPYGWNVTEVLNGTGALSAYSQWTWGSANSTLYIYDISQNSQEWLINMNSSNFLIGITLEEKQGISYQTLVANPTVNRSNTILRMNGTMLNSIVAAGDSNVSVYSGAQLIYTETRDQNTTYFGQVNFSDWTINDDITTNGIYDVYVYWTNTTHMGLWTTTFEAINTTSLTVVNDLNQTFFIEELLNLTVYYNNTTDNLPVKSANVTYEVFNRTNGQLVASQTDIDATLGDGYYNASIDTQDYVNGTYDLRITAEKPGCHNITLNQTFTLIYNTTLVRIEPTNVMTQNYNPFNLSIVVQYGRWNSILNVSNAVVNYTTNMTTQGQLDWNSSDETYYVQLNYTDYTLDNIYEININASKVGYQNQSQTIYWNLTTDGTDPTVIIDSPVDNFNTSLSSVQVDWTSSYDSESGIKNYQVLKNGSIEYSGTSTVQTISIDEGWNNLTVTAEDYAGNTGSSMIWVIMDSIYPTITITNPASNGTIEFGNIVSISGFVNGTGTVLISLMINNTNFSLFQDPTGGLSGNYEFRNSSNIVDGYLAVRINVTDSSSQTSNITLWFYIDNTPPAIASPPGDFGYELGDIDNWINWTWTDFDPDNYTITRNGTIDDSGTWLSGVAINYSVDGLAVEVYEFICSVQDGSGNLFSDTVYVTVTDTTAPAISSPPSNFGYELGATGNWINWTWTDLDPNNYTISRNGTSVDNGVWSSGVAINYSVDGLVVEVYEFIISVEDASGNPNSDTVLVTVTDTTSPAISSPPGDFGYELGATGNWINWTWTDLDPGTYSITRNGSSVDSGPWVSGVAINYSVDGLAVEVYEFIISIQDASGNPNSDTVYVTVTDTTPPAISSPPGDFGYELGATGNWINWTWTDLDPDNYTITQNGSSVDSGVWSTGVAINYSVDGLAVEVYEFIITVEDASGNPNSDTVYVTVSDTTPPAISIPPGDFGYELGATDNWINWTWTDLDPNNYTITRNGTSVDNGVWTSGVAINYSVDGLVVELYEFIITVEDASGNPNSDTVLVTVTDTTPPAISIPPGDFGYELGATGNWINWTWTDLDPNNYTITRNGTSVDNGIWTSDVAINYSVDGLVVEVYEFIITVEDASGNPNTDTVIITVTDTTPPSISSPPGDFGYELGVTGNWINWTWTDLDPNNYTITRNGTSVDNGVWTSGVAINYSVDGLVVEVYEFIITVEDASGNPSSDTVYVTVTDSTPPAISSPPGDFGYELGATGNWINWTWTDLDPNNYTITRNGTSVDTGPWSSGVAINYSVDGLVVEVYEFIITVEDASGNPNTDTVLVTVTDTTAPAISIPPSDFGYELGATGNWINWTWTDLDPDNFTITRNGTSVDSGVWTSGVAINYSVDGLTVEVYEFIITVQDASGNPNSDTVLVTVSDTTPPAISSPPGDFGYELGATGNWINWTWTDLDPNNYTITRNGTSVDNGVWLSSVSINFTVDSLVVEVYEFICTVEDASGNPNSDTVYVTVSDTTPPAISSPPGDFGYELGATDNWINWTWTDLDPNNYTITRNGTSVDNGVWTSGVAINYSVDGLVVEVYEFIITVEDASGNPNSDTVMVTVTDTTPPAISSPPGDFGYELGATGNWINWTWTDLDPDNYTITRNGTSVDTGPWSSGVSINYSVDGLGVEFYEFIITVQDTSGNPNTDTVYVTVTDTTPPAISSPPVDFGYELGANDNWINWTWTDLDPDNYTITRNGTSVDSGVWTSGVAINYSVDGLTVEIYEFIVSVQDASGNPNSDTVYVTITDTTPPAVSSPPVDFGYELGATDNWINWTWTDLNPDNYTITQNGSSVDSGVWSSGIAINYSVDGLAVEVYEFIITVEDASGNPNTDTVFVTVTDTTPPAISSPPGDFGYELGATGNWINWTWTDLDPDNYTITRNGTSVDSGVWSSGVAINYSVDGLAVEVHEFILTVQDASGNPNSDTVLVTVTDTTPPAIASPPGDFGYELGATGNWINWTWTDLDPNNYTITRNGTSVDTGPWSSGVAINYSVDGLTVEVYEFIITVEDASGNPNTDTVLVTVTDTTPPAISIPPGDFGYELGATDNWINWTWTDLDPNNYTITRNGTLVDNGVWTSGVAINYSVDGLVVDVYEFIITVEDASGNPNTDTVIVTVTDTTLPAISGPPGDFGYELGATGNWINWTWTDLDPDNYTITRNGSSVDSGTWNSGVAINYSVDGLAVEVYEFICSVQDASGNPNSDTVIVTVTDTTPPVISGPPGDFGYELGALGNWINWTWTDLDPGTYSITRNGSSVDSGPWVSGVAINYSVDGLAVEVYEFIITVQDASGNPNSDTVYVTVTDTTSPTISSPPGDFGYELGASGNWINWTWTDLDPDNYTITRNSTPINNGLWASNIAINYSVDGLPVDVYEFIITVQDASGNPNSDTVFVTVTDTTTPAISSPPGDFGYELGATGNWINWTWTDLDPDNYTITRNGTSVDNGIWLSGLTINYSVDGLAVEVYEFICLVQDSSGNPNSDTVYVTVTDTIIPSISSPPSDFNYELGSTGNWINWTWTDLDPDNYTVTRNGTVVGSGPWSSGVNISLNVDGLGIEVYEFICSVQDASGNPNSDTVYVTVQDTTVPAISSAPSDFTYELGSTSNSLSWTWTDLDPDNYTITRNGTSVANGNWLSGIAIPFNVDGLAVGVYEYLCTVQDGSGNPNSDIAYVTVEDTTVPTISSPPSDFGYELGATGNWINWTWTDLDPDNYTITRNGSSVDSGTWTSDIAVNFSVDGLAVEVYEFVITVQDNSSNPNSDTVYVTVSDTTIPAISSPPLDFSYELASTGNWINWTWTDLDPDNYTITRNGSSVDSGAWASGVAINYSVDGLAIEIYEFIITVQDASGNPNSDTVYVTVQDTTIPAISSPPGDFGYELGATDNWINWTWTDLEPDNYTITRNGSAVDSGTWTSGVAINYSVDGLAVGVYEFICNVQDLSENPNSDTVYVSVTDTIAPSVPIPPSDVNYELGATGNWINWTWTDLDSNNYTITRNGTGVDSGTWSSGIAINYSVDGLAVEVYEFIITVEDASGNPNSDTVIVTVTDTTLPVISSAPSDFTYELGSTTNTLSWTWTDLDPDNYTITRNGTSVDNNIWASGIAITINVDGLGVEVYEFICTVQDASGNPNSDVAYVTVEDTTTPVLPSAPSDVLYQFGTFGNWINWTWTDLAASEYNITQNGSLVDSGTWSTGVSINYSIDGLALDTYEFICYVNDTSGNSDSDLVMVTVTSGLTLSSPGDFSYEVGSTGNTISWTPSTIDTPEWYNITRNGTMIDDANWTSGTPIVLNIDGLGVEIYEFICSVNITTTESKSDTVFVTVDPDITDPSIGAPPSNVNYELGAGGNWINWTWTDTNVNLYNITRNGTGVDSGTWNSNVAINYSVDGLAVGVYEFICGVNDTYGNSNNDIVLVTVVDTTAPNIAVPPVDFGYELGATDNWINWTWTDLDPDNYTITRNGSSVDSGTWTSGVAINYSVDGLAVDVYVFVISVQDNSSNPNSDTVTLTVSDTTLPAISSPPGDFGYELGATGNWINWTWTDLDAATYTITRNGTGVDGGVWSSGVAINYSVDGLVVEVYEFVVTVLDASGNPNSDTVILTVSDTILPAISSPPGDFGYELGATDNWINWTWTDLDPDNYTITRNGTSFDSGSWSSGIPINYSVDGLAVDVYEFICTVQDASGNPNSDTVYVTVTDTTAPNIPAPPSDFSYELGSGGNIISWIWFDLDPDNYTITRNGSAIDSNIWASGVAITIPVNGLSVDVYEFICSVEDASDNPNSHTVFLTVEDTTNPSIPAPPSNVVYQFGYGGNWINWTWTDLDANEYNITRNGTMVDSGIWTSGVAINQSVDGLALGVYEYVCYVNDSSGNSNSDLILVTVNTGLTITSPPDIPYEVGTTGHSISWIGSTADTPDWYNITRNGTLVDNGTWVSGVPITIIVDGLAEGMYFYTCFINITSTEVKNDTVIVTVAQDVTNPSIAVPPGNVNYELGAGGNSITWTWTDTNPNIYNITRNGTQVDSGGWASGAPINIPVNGLAVGVYEYICGVNDSYGNSAVDTVLVTVVDTTTPNLFSATPDYPYELGSLGNTLSWTWTDLDPDNYTITRNGTGVDSGTWSSGVALTIFVDGLGVEVYEFICSVQDNSSNPASNTVYVTVVDTTLPAITAAPSNFTYELGSTTNTLSWTWDDLDPANYSIFRNGTNIDNGSWAALVPITINVDGLFIGVHEFNCSVQDASGNLNNYTVYVTVTDTTIPAISSPPGDFGYELGATGNWINWTWTDLEPDNYTITQNGSTVDSGTWTSGVAINYSVDGLAVDVYVFIISVQDNSSNPNSDTVILTVTDTTPPTISSPPGDFGYELGATGNWINWTWTDLDAATYTITRNGTGVDGGVWSSGVAINYSVDGLPVEIYEFVITVQDVSGNPNSDTVYVTVTDTIAPAISIPPSNFGYELGATGNWINWTWTDLDPNNYTITRNGSSMDSGSWSSGIGINYSVDGLAVEVYEFICSVEDASGNPNSDTVYVTVTDTTPPAISSPPSNFGYELGATGNWINWTWTDLDPDNYTITRNGTVVGSGPWSSGVNITLNVDGLGIEVYEFICSVQDASGNPNSDIIYVTVQDTTIPAISIAASSFTYELGSTTNTLSWTWDDLDPANYSIFRNGTNIDNGSWAALVPITINVDGLFIGVHEFNCTVQDASVNLNNHTVYVTVEDTVQPTSSAVPSLFIYELGSGGNTLSWTWNDLDPDNYTITRNGTGVDSGVWTSGVAINLPVDGLGVEVYQFVCNVEDGSGNLETDTHYLTVQDTITPIIPVPPSDVIYQFGYLDNWINWTWTDLAANEYNITRNGTLIDSGIWNTGIAINHSVDGLAVGIYEYICSVNDTSGNSDSDIVYVNVVTGLTILGPVNFNYEVGSLGNTISWLGSTADTEDWYNITRNGTMIDNGTWANGVPIILDIDGLAPDTYTFVCSINITTTESQSDTVVVTVDPDTTNPSIVGPPSDVNYELGATDNWINWTWTDTNPNLYNITRNGTGVDSGTWNSIVAINYSVDGLAVGVYEFICGVNDTYDNSASDVVYVTVVDTTAPNIPLPPSNVVYQIGATGNWINWTWIDLDALEYNITRNGSVVASGSWTSGAPIEHNIDGLASDTYIYRCYVNDSSGNSVFDEVQVTTIIDNTAPTINLTKPHLNGTTQAGNTYEIVGFANGTESAITSLVINDSRFSLSISPIGTDFGIFSFVNTSALPDGMIAVELMVNDTAGFSANVSVWFYVLQDSNNTKQEIYAGQVNIVYGTGIGGNIVSELIIFVSSDTNVTLTFFIGNPTNTSLGNSFGFFNFTLENPAALINVTMHLYYDESELGGIPETSLKIFYLNGSTWVDVNAIVNTTGNYLEWFSTSLSSFAIASTYTKPPDNWWIIIIILLILLFGLAAAVGLILVVRSRRKKKPKKEIKPEAKTEPKEPEDATLTGVLDEKAKKKKKKEIPFEEKKPEEKKPEEKAPEKKVKEEKKKEEPIKLDKFVEKPKEPKKVPFTRDKEDVVDALAFEPLELEAPPEFVEEKVKKRPKMTPLIPIMKTILKREYKEYFKLIKKKSPVYQGRIQALLERMAKGYVEIVDQEGQWEQNLAAIADHLKEFMTADWQAFEKIWNAVMVLYREKKVDKEVFVKLLISRGVIESKAVIEKLPYVVSDVIEKRSGTSVKLEDHFERKRAKKEVEERKTPGQKKFEERFKKRQEEREKKSKIVPFVEDGKKLSEAQKKKKPKKVAKSKKVEAKTKDSPK